MINKKTNLEEKIFELHSPKGKLRDDRGSRFVGEIVLDDGKKVAVYSLESGNWNPYGGIRNSGITKWQGINIYNGESEIEVKPMAMWRDGENQYNDNPSNHYIIKKLEKVDEDVYKLVLENFVDAVETYKIDFKNKKSELERK